MENPKIRFKGFTKDWEQRNVSEITKFHKQGFYTTEEYDNSKKYYLLRGTDLTENKLVLKDTPKIDATEKDYDAFKTEIGDFLIVRSGTVGTYGIVDVDIPAIFGSYLIDFRFDMEQVTNEFFGYFYQSSLFKSQLNKIIQASANTNINAENIKSTVISLPSLNEQRRISEYLGNLDNLITLHQRKCEQTKKLKKYMLQKMFPQNGAKVPEIRFYGFTYDWEQRKLGEVCSRVQGNDGRMNLPTLTISAANGWMNQEDRFSGNIAGKEQKNYTLLHKGELSYNHGNSKLAKYGTVFSLQSYKEALVPRVYHSFKVEEGSPDFLEYYFATKLPDRELGKLISSGARMDGLLNIGYNEFMGIQMLFPSVEEQKQISNYFRNLDTLITLHQRKCDELKKMKKYMLQNMFI